MPDSAKPDQKVKPTLQEKETTPAAVATAATTYTRPSRLKGKTNNTSSSTNMPETAGSRNKGKQPMSQRVNEDLMDLVECGSWSADIPDAPYESVRYDPTLYEYEPETEPSGAGKAPEEVTGQPRKIAKCKKRTAF
ncbi:hypothetical protein LMH87_005118 [Akanthomyces muscarius]|uniref:Uncharacterized protein n=1 Tax=Akanthomyces muscarius TaxID=2231603 RepID=A0A9W8QN39_AKAMU|nr:hypothetical protein LMH87_005118 [Akanthomyces muscarius]KAJ4163384.1 hypothetical protein LMH87_005118 [Akanthomyces muscarius]